jgi:hypothetical protein
MILLAQRLDGRGVGRSRETGKPSHAGLRTTSSRGGGGDGWARIAFTNRPRRRGQLRPVAPSGRLLDLGTWWLESGRTGGAWTTPEHCIRGKGVASARPGPRVTRDFESRVGFRRGTARQGSGEWSDRTRTQSGGSTTGAAPMRSAGTAPPSDSGRSPPLLNHIGATTTNSCSTSAPDPTRH